jgi:SAM-dependent methyltransferase
LGGAGRIARLKRKERFSGPDFLKTDVRPVQLLVFAKQILPVQKDTDSILFDVDMIYSRQPDAILKSFTSLAEWSSFTKHVDVYDRRRMSAMAGWVRQYGLHSAYAGFIREPDITEKPDGIHWDVAVKGVKNCERAVLDLLAASNIAKAGRNASIYAAEALSPLAMELRARYPRFIGSQFAPDPRAQDRIFPVQHQDLTSLSYPDGVFDATISIEVLEHIPDLQKALAEMARVLRPGGLMFATFPFNWNSEIGTQKAELVDGQIRHLVETPEYHGDPMQSQGILVFRIPAWDIIAMAREAGFTTAHLVYYSSAIGGLIGADMIGRFVFVCQR